MDENRLRQLAGINSTELNEAQKCMQELDLLEKMYQGANNLNMDTDVMSLEDIEARLEAVSRAFKAINKLKVRHPEMAKKHWKRVTSNMNTITAAMKFKLKQMEQEGEAEADPVAPAAAGM